MKLGNVVGSVWATRKAQCLQGQTFLAVRVGDEELVAADLVGAGPGKQVLLATGTAAARCCMDAPVDAAVVAVVGEEEADSPAGESCAEAGISRGSPAPAMPSTE